MDFCQDIGYNITNTNVKMELAPIFSYRKGDYMNKDSTKALALFTQIAISMLVPIFLCFFAGSAIDKFFKTEGIFLIIFTILGVLAGFRSVYALVKGFYKGRDTYIDMNKIKDDLKKEAEKNKEENNDK